ncbi:MAG: hypothetical protein QF440_06335 [Candidatus Thalassarchaeaceae archaeon]|jgi:hypothetical protein|nr:hypothetical protein [Candidatus Thalassarchaeaceae archaeon]
MAAEDQGPWWRIIAVMIILIFIGMNLIVWQYSGGANFSEILDDLMMGFILAFGITTLVLLMVSVGSIHRHMHWREQIVGLVLFSALGISLSSWLYEGDMGSTDNAIYEIRLGGAMLFNALTAVLAASGLVLGLLLALITGRHHTNDELLELESTQGDVSLQIPE